MVWQLKVLSLFVLVGLTVGVVLGASTGIAYGGDAKNGWVVFGIIGGCFGFLTFLAVPALRQKNTQSEQKDFKAWGCQETTFNNLGELSDELRNHVANSKDLEREIRFLEFVVKNYLVLRNFSLIEIEKAINNSFPEKEIKRAMALAGRLHKP